MFPNHERGPSFYYLAYNMSKNDERDPREISQRYRLRKADEPMVLSEAEFRHRYRLSKSAVQSLCLELSEKGLLKPTQRTTVEQKILCALAFFATGSYQRITGEARYFGQRTVSTIIAEVVEALLSPVMLGKYIKFPSTKQERDAVKNGFYEKFGIPGVVGAIDGCHFHIVKPEAKTEHLFYCRKHFHSLNVQMTCDSNNVITSINAKFGGAAHDAFVWESSMISDFMKSLHRQSQGQEHVWLLGDSGYPQREWLMTPFLNPVDGSPEAIYNKIHSKARVTIENTFGRLKNRWRCLHKDRTLHYSPEKCSKIVMSCAILHNIGIKFGLNSETETEVEDFSSATSAVPGLAEDLSFDLDRGRQLRRTLMQRLCQLHRS